MKTYLLSLLIVCLVAHSVSSKRYSEQELASYLAGEFETRASQECYKMNEASWNYETDVLNVTKQEALASQNLIFAAFEKQQWEEYWKDADYETFQDESVKRQLKFLKVLGTAALDEASLTELNKHQNAMSTVYSTAKICPYKKQQCDLATEGLSLDPGMEAVISESTDYDELTYVWAGWRNVSGAKMRDDYKKYVEYSNRAAVANGFSDMGAMWRKDYESETFVTDMQELWKQVEPLYVSLHTYVRNKLKARYPEQLADNDGLIPAHILGNMWAQSWVNLYNFVVPYPDASPVDVTAAMNEQGYDALRMFQTSDDFYLSLGLKKNDMSYDESKGAMLVRPEGREVVCHASAWDFCDRKDFRIKMCTKVNSEDFVTIHHEMGHIQYYLQYKDLPYVLRTGANPGFHEAVGDTIALSVSTPQHLEKIGLIEDYTDDDQAGINALMNIALEKVAFLPFGLLIDMWRWDVFSGEVKEAQWNSHWWSLRESIQRVKAPVTRTEKDFDPGSKYHVPNDSQYMAYFVAHILQFQFHKALCIKAGQYDPTNPETKPLYKCDIFQSKDAGDVLASGLSLGASVHWSDTLYVMTGERKLDGSAMLEYFAPLREYLDQQNSDTTC